MHNFPVASLRWMVGACPHCKGFARPGDLSMPNCHLTKVGNPLLCVSELPSGGSSRRMSAVAATEAFCALRYWQPVHTQLLRSAQVVVLCRPADDSSSITSQRSGNVLQHDCTPVLCPCALHCPFVTEVTVKVKLKMDAFLRPLHAFGLWRMI